MGNNTSVANMVGTTSDKPKCGCRSWIEHYKTNSPTKKKVIKCSVKGCRKAATVGAHVKIVFIKSNLSHKGHFDLPRVYIVPFCFSHNNMRKGDKVFLMDEIPLVRAHKCIRKKK